MSTKKTSIWRRFAALCSAVALGGSLALVVGVASVAAVVSADPDCDAIGGSDGGVLGTCVVGPGTFAVSGTYTINENLVLQNGAHLDATGTQPGGFTLIVAGNVTPAVSGNMTMESGSIIEGDDDGLADGANDGGSPLTINVKDDLLMQKGSRISSDNNTAHGPGGNITITAANVTLEGTPGPSDNCSYPSPDPSLGAVISSRADGSNGTVGGTINIAAGNYPGIPPVGTLITERCSRIDVGSLGGSGGEIILTAGHSMDLDGLVLSEAGESGIGAGQPRGGGPITAKSGCDLTVTDSGVVSSKGQDPGADLVLIKACDVVIFGVVQSTTTAGHAVAPNRCNQDTTAHPLGGATSFGACVAIVGKNITIDATGAHNGNVNVDGVRGPNRGWIDIIATVNILIKGEPAPAPKWAVSANAQSCASGPCDGSFGGVVTIKSRDGRIETSGQAVLQANAGFGSVGGVVTFHAGGPLAGGAGDVALDGSYIEALTTAINTGSAGGKIFIKSSNGAVTSGGDTTGRIDASGGATAGSVTLEDCTVGNQYLGTVVPAPTITDGDCGDPVILPQYALDLIATNEPIWNKCVPKTADKSGIKFDDRDNSGSFTPGDVPIENWPISLLDTSNVLVPGVVPNPTFTLADGSYHFVVPAPGTYRVCEGVGPGAFSTYVQTFPNAATLPPNANETVISTCPGPNVWGYQFTVAGGEVLTGNDFGNRAPPTCPEDPNSAPKLTRTVKPGQGSGGSGTPGNPANYDTVQAAYDAAKVSDKTEVIGLFSNTTENLGLDGSKSLTITQCTNARVTARNNSLPVWNITSTGKLTIIGPDAVGGSIGWRVAGNGGHTIKSLRANGASQWGVQIISSNNSVGWNAIDNNALGGLQAALGSNNNVLKGSSVSGNGGDGIQLLGNGNTLSGVSNIQSNKGNGVLVQGSTNTVKDNGRINLNSKDGILVTGSTNTLSGNKSESGKGNTFNGIEVASGTGNTLTSNQMNSNLGAGFNLAAGTGSKVQSNSTSNNTGNEYTIGSGNVDKTGNKKNGTSFTFTNAGGNIN